MGINDVQSTVTATHIKNNLVVTLPVDLSDGALDQVRSVTLDAIQDNPIVAVIFECSALKFIDINEFDDLKSICSMTGVLGVVPILTGLKPEIIKYLILADIDCSGIRAFLGLNEALDYLDQVQHSTLSFKA